VWRRSRAQVHFSSSPSPSPDPDFLHSSESGARSQRKRTNRPAGRWTAAGGAGWARSWASAMARARSGLVTAWGCSAEQPRAAVLSQGPLDHSVVRQAATRARSERRSAEMRRPQPPATQGSRTEHPSHSARAAPRFALAYLGANTITICRPSSLGSASTLAMVSKSPLTRCKTSIPSC